tara:strand:+ start:7319 stop:7729 length:411 start_codon:yes stop_codon:yes gene_type:complete
MGTRSLTFIHEMEDEYLKGDKVVCVFFRHFDGYPSGHGQDLADFLNGKKLVNGRSSDFDKATMFNRAGTMAVKLANHIQDISGAEIIHGDNYNYGQDHDYHVYFRNGEFCIQIDGMEPVKASEFNGKEMEKKLYED